MQGPSAVFTVVISHPISRPGREELINQVRHVSELYGGKVTGVSQINEHAFALRLAERLPDEDVEQARREATAFTHKRNENEHLFT